MDNALLDIIEEIIEMLEDEKYDSYVYDNNRFHIIDRYNNIDFEAKLSGNNYYFKDNISGMSYIKTMKFLNDKTTIQQILIQLENEKCFYSCLERKGYVNLARVIRVEGEDSLVCGNLNILNHTWEEILEYADECFEDIDNMDKIKAIELTPEDSEEVQLLADMEDEKIENEFGYTDDEEIDIDDDFDEENDDYEYEMNQIDENDQSGLFDIFEKNTIKDYETYIYNKEKSERNGKVSIVTSTSFFVPKPFTPFQWCSQDSQEVIREKIKYLLEKTKNIKGKKVWKDWKKYLYPLSRHF